MKTGFLLALLGVSATAGACCGVGHGGAAVTFTGQKNIIVWDAKNKTEHFVRDAEFDTKGKDLGFIAPTPSQPTLAEVDPGAFMTLASLEPRTAEAASTAGGVTTTALAGDVRVIDVQDVAGYRATILKATDPEALRSWLGKNGYPTPKFLDSWVKPYTDRGWYLTAFRVKGGKDVATGPVRMTFKTDRPFNPYSVPKENGGGNTSLRVYYVSAGTEVPMIGGTSPWRNSIWSANLSPDQSNLLADQLKLPMEAIPLGAKVTTYQDSEFGRPGLDDIYFVDTPFPIAAVAAGTGGAVLVLTMFATSRRRRNVVPA